MSNLIVRKVAVLGAGVMGAQIAAHLVNARVPVVLFDLASATGPRSGIARSAVEHLKTLSPAPLGIKEEADRIHVANYEDDLALLAECDVVIEAIAERMDWKHELYSKVAPHLAAHAIFASNTSGLSISALSQGLDLPDRSPSLLRRAHIVHRNAAACPRQRHRSRPPNPTRPARHQRNLPAQATHSTLLCPA